MSGLRVRRSKLWMVSSPELAKSSCHPSSGDRKRIWQTSHLQETIFILSDGDIWVKAKAGMQGIVLTPNSKAQLSASLVSRDPLITGFSSVCDFPASSLMSASRVFLGPERQEKCEILWSDLNTEVMKNSGKYKSICSVAKDSLTSTIIKRGSISKLGHNLPWLLESNLLYLLLCHDLILIYQEFKINLPWICSVLAKEGSWASWSKVSPRGHLGEQPVSVVQRMATKIKTNSSVTSLLNLLVIAISDTWPRPPIANQLFTRATIYNLKKNLLENRSFTETTISV